jgi:cell division protein FtsI/penicillin-binding protein 2
VRHSWLILVCLSICLPAAKAQSAAGRQSSLDLSLSNALSQTLHGTSAAAILLDTVSGQPIAVVRPQEAQRLRALPGSTLKPFFLAQALEEGFATAHQRVFCQRSLHIAGRPLPCTHPQIVDPLDASQALAYSCNTYFADLARRMRAESLMTAARHYGLADSIAPHPPSSETDRQLFVLGLAGIAVSPAQLAEAYRRLWNHSNDPALRSTLEPVQAGLRGSVQYGMAHSAAVDGMEIYGKTGTAADPSNPHTHGWFAGIATLSDRTCVLVIYLPNASGGDAATLAGHFYLRLRNQHP